MPAARSVKEVRVMAETAPLVDAGIPVCRWPEAAETVREYLRKATVLILDALGEDAVAAVVVSGSSTLGELTAAAFQGEGPFVLSDIDVAVVSMDDSRRDAARSVRPELLRRLAALPEAAAILPGAELGVYSLRDLEIQTPKMGVLEMRTGGKTLWGDPAALGRLPAFGPEEIPREEAVALIYNRCLELLDAFYSFTSHDPRDAMRLLYAAAKSFVDVGTAIAAFHGAYAPGYRRRLHELESLLESRYPEGVGTLDAGSLLEDLAFWTQFKLDPDLTKVTERYGCAPDRAGLSEAAVRACLEARRPLTEAWGSLAAGSAWAGGDPLETCTSMIGVEGLRGRLRGWRRLVGAGEVSAIRAVSLARHGSPLQLLRLCAVCAMNEPWGPSGGPLRPSARSFLETYFPAPPRNEGAGYDADRWRAHIARVWNRWIERFWS